MFSRTVGPCARTIRPALCRPSLRCGKAQRRRYSMPASAAPTGSPSSSAGILAPFTNELDKIAPSFRIHGSRVQVIKTPTDFYETLKTKIRGAKNRIFLSTLYIGKTEKELVCDRLCMHLC